MVTRWFDAESTKMADKATKFNENVAKIDESTKSFTTDATCTKALTCKIFKDNMVSWKDTASKRQRCIAMTDTIQPNLNCQWEVMTDEEFGAGKYSLVKIDKKVYRCVTPVITPATPEKARFKAKGPQSNLSSTVQLLANFKQEDAKEYECPPMDLTIFNITNPNNCLPCGSSG